MKTQASDRWGKDQFWFQFGEKALKAHCYRKLFASTLYRHTFSVNRITLAGEERWSNWKNGETVYDNDFSGLHLWHLGCFCHWGTDWISILRRGRKIFKPFMLFFTRKARKRRIKLGRINYCCAGCIRRGLISVQSSISYANWERKVVENRERENEVGKRRIIRAVWTILFPIVWVDGITLFSFV